MENISDNWIDYWNTETLLTDAKWQKDMELFIKTTTPLLNYNAQDVILDIGCGPGFLASLLTDRVKEIHCADTSERYLDICKKKFGKEQNIFFHKLSSKDYTDLSFLEANKFSIIICLSVIQYYKNINEVERLIKEVQRIALPGSRFLIADILTQEGFISDLWKLLKSSFRERYLIEALRFLVKARTSDYYKIRSLQGLLIIPVEQLEDLIAKLNLNAKILNTQLTAINRKHLLITF